MYSNERSFRIMDFECHLYNGMTEDAWLEHREKYPTPSSEGTGFFSDELSEKIDSTLKEREALHSAVLHSSNGEEGLVDPNNCREEARVNVDHLPQDLKEKTGVGTYYQYERNNPLEGERQHPVIFPEKFARTPVRTEVATGKQRD
ncbi:MAG: hypothetical protein ACOY3I_10010 [Verrucomicrobiota bacterium]